MTPPRRRSSLRTLDQVEAGIIDCRRCPRLVRWREQVAREKRASFRDWEYWGRPVPGFGDPTAAVMILGLAPAAHGANRTGRMFTGDRSGDFLFRSLWRTGFANQPESVSREDGLTLTGCWITAPVRCAPPANKPTPKERDTCAPWLRAELKLLPQVCVIVCLGGFAWSSALRLLIAPSPRPKFGHGVEAKLHARGRSDLITLLGCFHVSQQNTFTKRLTEPMLDAVFERARGLALVSPAFS